MADGAWRTEPDRDRRLFGVRFPQPFRFCENETNLKVIQEIMGHADITTTMDVYNEATREKKRESFADLEGRIRIS